MYTASRHRLRCHFSSHEPYLSPSSHPTHLTMDADPFDQVQSQREEYLPPTEGQAISQPERDTDVVTTYLCGDCNAKVPLKNGDPVRCKECGHRVLYKERTNRYVTAWIVSANPAGWCSLRLDDAWTVS
jgi:DNA-directed RNA polymerase I, II, and III subunit RPABC4